MRPWVGLLFLSLGACAQAPRGDGSGNPALLAALQGHPDPTRREEVVAGLSIRGRSIAEAL